jgi:hypothetical protein
MVTCNDKYPPRHVTRGCDPGTSARPAPAVGQPGGGGDSGDVSTGGSGGGARQRWEVVAEAGASAGGVRWWRGHRRLVGQRIN